MTSYSFARIGRNFGRSTSGSIRLADIHDKLPLFTKIHERFKGVQVENQDWEQCIHDYDSHDTVFYIDPPYIELSHGVYTNTMSHEDHRRLLKTIFNCKGFCAVSGYSNPLYDNQSWDDIKTWKMFVPIQSMASSEGNNKDNLDVQENRGHSVECLWIKEANIE
jgi:DNA adenine methylase